MLLLCPTTSYLNANRTGSDIANRGQSTRVTWPFTWLKDNVLPLYYMAASLSPDTNVEWCKIKAKTVTSNPITAEKFLSASQRWNHMRFSSTTFSQNKIHLFVLQNTVDLLCKPYRWILSLCTVQRIALAQGSTFPPVTMKKTFTAPIILYPCVAPENTIAATVNEIIAMGE